MSEFEYLREKREKRELVLSKFPPEFRDNIHTDLRARVVECLCKSENPDIVYHLVEMLIKNHEELADSYKRYIQLGHPPVIIANLSKEGAEMLNKNKKS